MKKTITVSILALLLSSVADFLRVFRVEIVVVAWPSHVEYLVFLCVLSGKIFKRSTLNAFSPLSNFS